MSSTSPVSSITIGGAEIAVYSRSHAVALATGSDAVLRLVNLTDIAAPSLITSFSLDANAQSVAVAGDLVAVAKVNPTDKALPGTVEFFRLSGSGASANLTSLGAVTVGALPDSVTFNPEGTKLVVANEGEAIDSTTTDAIGAISIIDVASFSEATTNVSGFTVSNLGFEAYNNQKVKLELLGIRLSEGTPGASAAQDFEPEAIAVVGNKAYVTLQENNAIAEVDLANGKITDIWSLGIKDWSRGTPEAVNYSFELTYTGIRPDFNGNGMVEAGEVVAGGLSGLWYQGKEGSTEYYLTISDRGPQAANIGDRPNDNPGDPNKGEKIFDDPDFTPTIYRLAKTGDQVTVVDTISLKVPDGDGGFRLATGIGELPSKDDKAFTLKTAGNGITGDPGQYNVYEQVAWDAFGLDTESVNYFSAAGLNDGKPVFAISDEYRPQVAIFDAGTGNLIQRFVPSNTDYNSVSYEAGRGDVAGFTSFTLPVVYSDRQANRGFEGMAFNSKDGLLYAFVQSPLRPTGYKDKEFIRILAINPVSGQPVHEYLSLLPIEAGQDKIGDAVYDAARDVFVIIERDSELGITANKSITEINLKGATDTLDYTLAQNGKSWAALLDGKAQPELVDIKSTTFGSIADLLASQNIAMAHRDELFNLPSVLGADPAFDKAEGIALKPDGSLVFAFDNDFVKVDGRADNILTEVSFTPSPIDTNDKDGQTNDIAIRKLYGLTMADGLDAFSQGGQTFIIVAGEGDDRAGDLDNSISTPDKTRAGSLPGADTANLGTRLNLVNTEGDYDGDGTLDQAYAFGSRSFRIYDQNQNLIFDSGNQLEELAKQLGIYDEGRSDDKGTEPEMVITQEIGGLIYAFIGLERGLTSTVAVYDITNPYNPRYVQALVSEGSLSPEGVKFVATENSGGGYLMAANEVSGTLDFFAFNPFKLQLFHLSDQEGNISALDDAPGLSGVLNALRAEDLDGDGVAGFANTLTLSSGDAWIPGLFYSAGAQAYGGAGRGDVLIQNALGVQAVAFGNHEFDLGTSAVKNLISANEAAGYPGTVFPYLSGTIDFSTDANLAGLVVPAGQAPKPNSITASTVFELSGEKIGVVGATTPWLKTISSPGSVGMEPASFSTTPTSADLDALAAVIQADVDALITANPGLNKVILLAHMQQIGIEQSLAERLHNVDIIVAGGSNTRLFDGNDSVRPGDVAQGAYPIIKTDADAKPVAVVNTDGNYKYLGRLVIDFDTAGNIIPESYDAGVSGAYRTDAAGVAALNAESLIDATVQKVVDDLRAVIVAQESEWFGISEVFLNGNRNPGVRSEETNLGDLTADANLAYARTIDPSVIVALKNGGGVRNSIGQSLVPTGSADGTPELLPTAEVVDAQGNVVKPEGGISRNDIANALSFNNGLSLVSVTATELKTLIEHGIAAGVNQGRFPQVSGLAFSYDLSRPEGSRVVSLTIEDQLGNDLDVIVRGGNVVGDPERSIRMVTLDFLAGGGDGYPFTTLRNPNRVDITDKLGDRTGIATFAANGSEQDALAEYLAQNHPTTETAFKLADTSADQDSRLQNLAVRDDQVIDPVKVGTEHNDVIWAGVTPELPTVDGKYDVLFTGAGDDEVDVEANSGFNNNIFTGSGADVIYAGSRDVIIGGSGTDEIYALSGNNNRLSGNSGDDLFVIGSSGNRALGGDGNDRFEILETAGTNYLNGGAGADQFWLINGPGDLPMAKQFVMDFTAGEDLVGLQGVSFADLSFTQVGADTLLSVAGTAVGHFTNVNVSSLNNQVNFAGLA